MGRTGCRHRVDQRRRRHDRVVLEREGRNHQARRREAQEIAERCPHAVQPLGFRRPPELTKQRGRIEDVAARRVRPFAVDESRELYRVEVAKPCAGGIDQVYASLAGPRRKGVRLDPASNDRCDKHRSRPGVRRTARIRVAQAGERVEDGASTAHLSGTRGIVGTGQTLVASEKRQEMVEMRAARRTRTQRLQFACKRQPLPSRPGSLRADAVIRAMRRSAGRVPPSPRGSPLRSDRDRKRQLHVARVRCLPTRNENVETAGARPAAIGQSFP